MSNTELLVVIVLVELVVIIGLVLLTVLVLAGRRKRREKRAAHNVAERVRSEESSRDTELRELLHERFGYEGDELEQKVRELVQAERQFYARFLDLYLNRDPEAAECVQEYLHDVVRPYTEIEVATAEREDADEDGGDGGATPKDAVPPTAEGRDMYEEIQTYRQTLNLVFAEYTAMFGINQDRNEQLSAREIRERMESGQLAGPDSGSE